MSDAGGTVHRRRRACAWIVELDASVGWRSRDSIAGGRWTRGAILVLCLSLHLALLAWLQRQDGVVVRAAPARPLLIEFIERSPVPSPPPPMPRPRSSKPKHALRAVHLEPPAPAHSDAEREAMPDTAPSLPPGRRLLDAVPGFAASIRDEVGVAPRDLLRAPEPRLPGSDVAIVEGIRLRHRLTPEDVVRGVGALFGGNYDPCPDQLGKLHDATIVQPGRYSDAERRALVERTRRCRYR